jgi:GNAT superfamily N-acetyltransferase
VELRIEPARPEDVPLILELIRELAEFEKEPESAKATAEQIHEALFGERAAAEAVIARIDGVAVGWALWFQNFSTWTGRPGLWLEDLFVRPQHRRNGVGRALLGYLARLCVERGYGRFEWSVLDWNTPSIEFYKALGAEAMSEWTTMRVSGEALSRLVGEGGGTPA